MKKSLILSCILGLSLCFIACGRTEQKEELGEVSAQVPVKEEVTISQPPAYEVPLRPKDVIGNDGVWEAEKEAVFGVAVPKLRENVKCDGIRYCDFSVRMTAKQVEDFIAKYFPYQEMRRLPVIDGFEVMRKIKPELAKDGIVPSFDPLIQRPKEGEEVHISIEWSKKYNAYAWYYKSAFAYHEDEAQMRESERKEREQTIAVLSKLFDNNGVVAFLSEAEKEFLISRDVLITDDGKIDDASMKMLRE